MARRPCQAALDEPNTGAGRTADTCHGVIDRLSAAIAVGTALPQVPADEARARRLAYINGLGATAKAERENGQRKTSIRDLHSFRVTWITLALAAGVPLELVQRVTGHRTVEVVMKHYFRPGREDFQQTIMKAMPKMLADGAASNSVKGQLQRLLEGMTARTWRAHQAKALRLLAEL